VVDFPFDYKAFAALMSGVVDSDRQKNHRNRKQRHPQDDPGDTDRCRLLG
jgi:hypothetical protein